MSGVLLDTNQLAISQGLVAKALAIELGRRSVSVVLFNERELIAVTA